MARHIGQKLWPLLARSQGFSALRKDEALWAACGAVRWVLVLGGMLTLAGMWWFLQAVDLFGGPGNQLALVGGSLTFLVGLLLIGFGLKGEVGGGGDFSP